MQLDDRAARLNWDQARALLGVSVEATDAELRAAYLEKVQQFPPDRDPEQFELVRDAYEQLRDPRLRARRVLEGPDPFAPLSELLVNLPPAQRKFVGVEPWLAVLKEKQA
jgi:hypothetical protein